MNKNMNDLAQETSFLSTVTEIKIPDLEEFNKAINVFAIVDRCYDLGISDQILMTDNVTLPELIQKLEACNITFELERL